MLMPLNRLCPLFIPLTHPWLRWDGRTLAALSTATNQTRWKYVGDLVFTPLKVVQEAAGIGDVTIMRVFNRIVQLGLQLGCTTNGWRAFGIDFECFMDEHAYVVPDASNLILDMQHPDIDAERYVPTKLMLLIDRHTLLSKEIQTVEDGLEERLGSYGKKRCRLCGVLATNSQKQESSKYTVVISEPTNPPRDTP